MWLLGVRLYSRGQTEWWALVEFESDEVLALKRETMGHQYIEEFKPQN